MNLTIYGFDLLSAQFTIEVEYCLCSLIQHAASFSLHYFLLKALIIYTQAPIPPFAFLEYRSCPF